MIPIRKIYSYSGLCLLLLLPTLLQAQSFTVSPNKVSAFTENPLQVKIEAWDCEQMQVRTDNGKMKKVGPCKYILIPQRIGQANISVSKVQGGVVVDLGSKVIIAEGRSLAAVRANKDKVNVESNSKLALEPEPPLFQATFNGQADGILRKRFDFKKNKLLLLCADNKALVGAAILSFNAQLIVGDEMVYDQEIKGDAMDLATIRAIQLQSGPTLLRIASIEVKSKGKILKLKDLEFEIK